MGTKKTLVMIPTYNERENVEKMARDIVATGIDTDILFIDDNSPDGTGDLLDGLATTIPRLMVLHRPGKQGIGSAHKDGIAWVYEHGYTHLVTMDCDFTHSPENIKDLLAFSEEYDVVVGSRHMRENSLEGWNMWRKCITRTGHLLTTVLLNMPYDATGAFRLYRLDRIPKGIFALVESRGYSFFFESLTIINLNRFRINEVPIALPPRTYGHSKLQLRDMVHALVFMVTIFLNIRFNNKKLLIQKS
jgi:dolichol-phosphate mannosyltransferase